MAGIAGIAYVKANGRQFPLRGNFSVSPSKLERAMIAGQDSVHGFSEMPRVPFIEGDITMDGILTVAQIDAMVDVTVTAELRNGKTYVLQHAATTAASTINARDGTTHVRWEGTVCDEF